MVSFAAVISAAEAEAIRAYVIKRANDTYEATTARWFGVVVVALLPTSPRVVLLIGRREALSVRQRLAAQFTLAASCLAIRSAAPKLAPFLGATGFDVGRETPGACRGAGFLVKPLANL